MKMIFNIVTDATGLAGQGSGMAAATKEIRRTMKAAGTGKDKCLQASMGIETGLVLK